MHICSNPDCLRFTVYSTTEENTRSIAEAAHINAASGQGPRAIIMDEEELKKAENGIWLCSICHTKVDNDACYYDEKKTQSLESKP
ncbi:HNH endonuclease [Aeromonas dhakensis]|uniref:HNH endonuclease n=1 Tax=Aeromonas dhakensis TaxID=196024 RepID=UPI003C6EC2E0